jgi:hypothetical protein
MTNWPIVSACHAGRLGDHPTPVGSVRWLSAPLRAGCVSRSRIRPIGSAHHPPTDASPRAGDTFLPVLTPEDFRSPGYMEYPCHTCAGDDHSSDHLLLIHFTGKVSQAALTLLVFERIFHVASTGLAPSSELSWPEEPEACGPSSCKRVVSLVAAG